MITLCETLATCDVTRASPDPPPRMRHVSPFRSTQPVDVSLIAETLEAEPRSDISCQSSEASCRCVSRVEVALRHQGQLRLGGATDRMVDDLRGRVWLGTVA